MSNGRTHKSFHDSLVGKTKDAVETYKCLGTAYVSRQEGQYFAGGVVATVVDGNCMSSELKSVHHVASESLDQTAIASVFISACTDAATKSSA